MAEFNYEAIDSNGKLLKGTAVGTDTDMVIADLREHGLNPISVIELDSKGKEKDGGLLGKLGIIAASFLVGFLLPLINGSIRGEILKNGGFGTLLGVMFGVGIVAALVAVMFTVTEKIKSPALKLLTQLGCVLLIVVLILATFFVLAETLRWQ